MSVAASPLQLAGAETSGRPALTFQRIAIIVAIPLACALLGLLVRYAAYAAFTPNANPAAFAGALCKWDCTWYIRIADTGYDPFPTPSMSPGGNWAFFPLFPALVTLARLATGLPTIVAATGLSLLLSIATAIIAWPLFRGRLRPYALFSAYLLSGPFSIYFTTSYSEAAFVLLLTGVLVALQFRNYATAGLVGALLSATRIVGVLIVFTIILQFWLDRRAAGRSLRQAIGDGIRRPDLVFAVFVAPLGLFAYMAFLYRQVGDALAFSHVQRAWARTFGNPFEFWWTGLTRLPPGDHWPTTSAILALSVSAGVLLSLMLIWRRQWPAALFCVLSLVLPLFAGLASVLRFTSALSPIMILLADVLGRWWWLFVVAGLGIVALDYVLTIAWLQGNLALV